MSQKIGILIVLILVITTIPIATSPSGTSTHENLGSNRWYRHCYVEIEGFTYASYRSLFLPHFLGSNYTFCLLWFQRFEDNETIKIYRMKGGKLIHEQNDLREYKMLRFFGTYNYRGDPQILKGRVLAIKTFNKWTIP